MPVPYSQGAPEHFFVNFKFQLAPSSRRTDKKELKVETYILFGDRPRWGQILSQKHSAAFGISEEISSNGRIKLEKKKIR